MERSVGRRVVSDCEGSGWSGLKEGEERRVRTSAPSAWSWLRVCGIASGGAGATLVVVVCQTWSNVESGCLPFPFPFPIPVSSSTAVNGPVPASKK